MATASSSLIPTMTTRSHYHCTLYKVLCKCSETFNQWLCFYDNQLEARLIWDPAYLWYCTGWSELNDKRKKKCHTQYLNYKLGDFFSYSHGFKRIDQGHRFGLFLRLWWVCISSYDLGAVGEEQRCSCVDRGALSCSTPSTKCTILCRPANQNAEV